MENIELVIKMPEVFYEAIRNTDVIVSGQRSGKTLMSVICSAVAKGTPLPKEHGRLIDADALGEKLYRYTEAPYQYALTVFNESLTIIAADKEVKNNDI